jgi:glycogen debranching enzyme
MYPDGSLVKGPKALCELQGYVYNAWVRMAEVFDAARTRQQPWHATPSRGQACRGLMAPDMWTGWGIRTLSADRRVFNPYNYQTGSVWPHDNAIIAMGFKFYGFGPEAARVAHDVSVAASHFLLNQLPELYTAAERTETNFRFSIWARTCRKRGPPARSSCWFRPCWDFSRMPPATSSMSIRRFRLGCRI